MIVTTFHMPDKVCVFKLSYAYTCMFACRLKLPVRANCPLPLYVDYHVHVWLA